MGRLVLLSGPSCVGKGPLYSALERFYPELAKSLEFLVLYNTRAPRPGEKDGEAYHFRPQADIEALQKQEGFIVMDVRGDLQALEIASVKRITDKGKDAFYEGNPFVATSVMSSPTLASISRLSVFLSPLSKEEIIHLQDPGNKVSLPDFVTDVMRRKLLRRTRKQKGILSLKDLENIERRASSAYQEMKLAWQFDHILPNHDGEDSENWDAFYHPIGDARR
ncbi:MAG: hypothetical protein GTO14_10965, partial [Anaerolineales bacterium]|nr:hypothetical protein [Anaerolineales bacterium]